MTRDNKSNKSAQSGTKGDIYLECLVTVDEARQKAL